LNVELIGKKAVRILKPEAVLSINLLKNLSTETLKAKDIRKFNKI
jgi:hypothetical protein